MSRTIGTALLAASLTAVMGFSRPASAQTGFTHDQYREQGLRHFWEAQLPLKGGEVVRGCYKRAGTIFCTTSHAAVFAVDARAGVIAWSRQVGHLGDIIFPPTVSLGVGLDDAVVITSQSSVSVFDRKSGELLIEGKIPFGPSGPAVASDELLWGGALDGMMYAHLPSGFNLWRFKTAGAITAAPLLLPHRIVFASNDGFVYCATPIDKRRIWVFDAIGSVIGTPAFRDDLLYVSSKDHRVYCLNVETGELLWQFLSPASLEASPHATVDTLYQYCGEGGMLALDRENGRQRWVLPEGISFVAQHKNIAYVRDVAGQLIAIDNRNGEVRNRLNVPYMDIAAANTDDAGIFGSSYGGLVTCLQPLDVPYLRSGEIAAALRRARPKPDEAADDALWTDDATTRPPARDPLESTSKIPPLTGRTGG